MRSGLQKDFTRIVLDSSHQPKWEYEVLNKKIILKVNQAILKNLDPEDIRLPRATGLIRNVYLERTSQQGMDAHILFKFPVKILKAFTIPPSAENPHYRVVLDVTKVSVGEPIKTTTKIPQKKAAETPTRKEPPKKVTPPTEEVKIIAPQTTAPQVTLEKPALRPQSKWPKIIVVDPGHGGADPGAIGYTKTREKDITLAMAKTLKEVLTKDKKYKVILTRDRDKFTSLTDRVKTTQMSGADLFISLHADSHVKSESRGLSIYTLSKVASDQEAARLAAKENKADLFLGLSLDSQSPEVAGILIDLMKRETMNLSAKFASKLEEKLRPRTRFLDNGRRSANFAVLRIPDIPGILVELGYISNPQDEKLLKTDDHRQKVAMGIKDAIDIYFMEN